MVVSDVYTLIDNPKLTKVFLYLTVAYFSINSIPFTFFCVIIKMISRFFNDTFHNVIHIIFIVKKIIKVLWCIPPQSVHIVPEITFGLFNKLFCRNKFYLHIFSIIVKGNKMPCANRYLFDTRSYFCFYAAFCREFRIVASIHSSISLSTKATHLGPIFTLSGKFPSLIRSYKVVRLNPTRFNTSGTRINRLTLVSLFFFIVCPLLLYVISMRFHFSLCCFDVNNDSDFAYDNLGTFKEVFFEKFEGKRMER